MGDDKLKVIAAELITQVRKSVTIDWTLRESARAKIKVMVKRILNKYGYPPDLQEEAVKTVLVQAELLKESLVYWLEFKNDDEFPGPKFGSIAGGSAHKFGLFRRKETGQWVDAKGNDITEAQAIELAQRNREQLLACVELLNQLPVGASDDAYQQLQSDIESTAPVIAKSGWAHKYLSLLFPDKLDDYHNHAWQRHNLIKSLQMPPATEGLYASAGRFVQMTAQLGWPMNHLTSALNERNGAPIRYWRIGTKVEDGIDIWPAMSKGGYAAIGWPLTGDLSDLVTEGSMRSAILELLGENYSNYPGNVASRKAGEITNFVEKIKAGDVVVAADGARILGIGKVTGPYRFDSSIPEEAPHRRDVDWYPFGDQVLPQTHEGLRTTVWKLSTEAGILEIEQLLLQRKANPVVIISKGTKSIALLDGIPGKVQGILERKGQVILYGPPGTGKTYWARRAARELASMSAFGQAYEQLSVDQKTEVDGDREHDGLVRCCTFHPAYGYEDFIEGFRPVTSQTGHLVFEERTGIFKGLCADAAKQPHRQFFLLVDEINRGDIPRIFGELLTLLELDKRGMTLSLPVSGAKFSVPPNVRLIGTMNTADRSIALLDTALRRRFGFVELMPEIGVFGNVSMEQLIPLGPWLAAMNERIRAHLGRDARNLQIGHAYLLENGQAVTDWEKFVRILAEDIIPLLEEYCYEDYSALVKILGTGLVDESRQKIRDELFASGRREDLIQALIAPAPEIATSGNMTAVSENSDEAEEPEAEESDA
jgi:5-methylcytosine-specific restriction enzyme B